MTKTEWTMPENDLLTLNEASELLNIKGRMLCRMVRAKKLPSPKKIGGQWRFSRRVLEIAATEANLPLTVSADSSSLVGLLADLPTEQREAILGIVKLAKSAVQHEPLGQASPRSDCLDIEEAASFLKVSTKTLYRLTKAKKIPHRKVGKQIRFSRLTLEQFLCAPVAPSTKATGRPNPHRALDSSPSFSWRTRVANGED